MKLSSIVKFLISTFAVALIIGRLLYPSLQFETSTIMLAIIALLPWIMDFVKSAELPGGVKIEFRDLEKAGEKINQNPPKIQKSSSSPKIIRPPFLEIADLDPNLALVSLRIELEKRLRLLAIKHNLPSQQTIAQLVNELQEAKIIGKNYSEGLLEIIKAGNLAAHGAKVDAKTERWALDNATGILARLDLILSEGEVEDVNEWLKTSVAILQFLGQDVIERSIRQMRSAQEMGVLNVYTLDGYDNPNWKTSDALLRIGAFRKIDEGKNTIKLELTPLGHSLLSYFFKE